MRALGAILLLGMSLPLGPGAASAGDRVSVRVSYHRTADPDAVADWLRLDRELAAAERRILELEPRRPGDRAYPELRADVRRRQVDLALGWDATLVQECVVSPGRRVAQRTPVPGYAEGNDFVLHVLVASVEADHVLMDLDVEYDGPGNQVPSSVLFDRPTPRAIGRPTLHSAAATNPNLAGIEGAPVFMDVRIARVERAPDATQDHCRTPRHPAPPPAARRPQPRRTDGPLVGTRVDPAP